LAKTLSRDDEHRTADNKSTAKHRKKKNAPVARNTVVLEDLVAELGYSTKNKQKSKWQQLLFVKRYSERLIDDNNRDKSKEHSCPLYCGWKFTPQYYRHCHRNQDSQLGERTRKAYAPVMNTLLIKNKGKEKEKTSGNPNKNCPVDTIDSLEYLMSIGEYRRQFLEEILPATDQRRRVKNKQQSRYDNRSQIVE